jgi:two-component system response regulator FixJ
VENRSTRSLNKPMAAERTVYVVEDDATIGRSLVRLLDAAGLSPILYESPSAFLADATELLPGCILLDVKMPGVDGLTLQARLAKLDNHLPVVVMTGYGDVKTAVQAMKGGAVDFIEKPYEDEVLVKAIELALSLPGWSGHKPEGAEAARRVATLSPREHQVLDALVAGRSNKVIAYDLSISARTVEVHRAHMMDRLGVRHHAEAIRLAVLAGAFGASSLWLLSR